MQDFIHQQYLPLLPNCIGLGGFVYDVNHIRVDLRRKSVKDIFHTRYPNESCVENTIHFAKPSFCVQNCIINVYTCQGCNFFPHQIFIYGHLTSLSLVSSQNPPGRARSRQPSFPTALDLKSPFIPWMWRKFCGIPPSKGLRSTAEKMMPNPPQ